MVLFSSVAFTRFTNFVIIWHCYHMVKWLDQAYNITLYSIGIPFPEKQMMYFWYSGVYRRGKSYRGVLISTMTKNVTLFLKYCWARQRPIPIFKYTELELLLQWYKYIQKYRIPLQTSIISKTNVKFPKMFVTFGDISRPYLCIRLGNRLGTTLRTNEWTIKDERSP